MGRYIAWDDVVAAYKSVAKEFDSAEANAYCVRAEDEVDARLAPVYTVPFSPGSVNVPGAVRDLCIDLAYYKMAWRQDGMEPLYMSIQDRFKAIIRGDMALTTSAGVVARSGTAWVSTSYSGSFGVDDELNWSVSSDWQDAIDGGRS